jgi:hypothetical protein
MVAVDGVDAWGTSAAATVAVAAWFGHRMHWSFREHPKVSPIVHRLFGNVAAHGSDKTIPSGNASEVTARVERLTTSSSVSVDAAIVEGVRANARTGSPCARGISTWASDTGLRRSTSNSPGEALLVVLALDHRYILLPSALTSKAI